MKKLIFIIAWLGLLFTACNSATPPDLAETQGEGIATPTREGTWNSVIDGYIYDFNTESSQPIAGATIRYEIVLSYFPEIQDGHPNETVTDATGEFILPVIVHDTDNMRVVIEADGYLPYEHNFVGMDLAAGETLTIGLVPTTDAP